MTELHPKAFGAAPRRSAPPPPAAIPSGQCRERSCTPRGNAFRSLVFGAPFALVLGLSAPARAVDCDTTLSACFDANNLDIPAGPAEFVSIEKGTALEPGRVAIGLTGSYLRKPVELVAPSPDPEGREVPLVDDIWQLDLVAAIGLLPGLQLGFAFPIRIAQDGAGIEAATTRQGNSLSDTAIVDPRVGVGYQVLAEPVAAKLRLELKLPLGDEDAFAGTDGVELIPALLVSSNDLNGFHIAADIGARFRQSAQLGDVRIGNQLRFALGVRYDVLPELSVGVEAWVLPSLAQQPETADGRGTFLPAEWMGSVTTPLIPYATLMAAAGTGIPLSQPPAGHDGELGVTTPVWRAFLGIRVSDEPATKDAPKAGSSEPAR